MTGSAYAYQTYETDMTADVAIGVDPMVVIVEPATWTNEQRMLWNQHRTSLPAHWTTEQRAAFNTMMAHPPAHWTAEQRILYSEHFAMLPSTWTDAQRAAYEQQVAGLRTPWLSATQTATTTTTTTTTSYAATTGLPAVVQPSNANPEHDARGIPVISDVAYVPTGFNGTAGAAVGGPVEADDDSYPPCTRERTDNCTQTYEVGANPR